MASTALPTSHYRPLDPERHDIRVLSIFPSSNGDSEIFCGLEIQSLDNSPSYNALSYCWGADPETPVIDVMGAKLAVKPNLFAALKQLRDPSEIVRLWVDAVCINQSDMDERGSQVSIMGLVYQRAQIVYAWLGDEADNSAESMVLLQILQTLLFGDSPGQIRLLQREEFLLGWRALIRLLRRPYWTRAWIVQELLLAENVMICCGRQKVAWPTLVLLVSEIIPEWYGELGLSPDSDKGDPFSETLRRLQYIAYDFDHLYRLSIKHQMCLANGTSEARSLDLLDCLTMCRWRSATDDRDHVYSMLSLADAKHVKPDYNKPAEWLFREAVMLDIEARGSLDILSGCKHFAEEERDFGRFSADMTNQLLQNELLLKSLTKTSTVFPPSVESLGIGEHPPWYERAATFVQDDYERLTTLAQDIISEESSGTVYGEGVDEMSFLVLSSLLVRVKAHERSGASHKVLSNIQEFESTLQRFLTRHKVSTSCRLLNASLPTWVPNWTLPLLTPKQSILLQDENRGLYQAACKSTPRVRFQDDQRKMTVEGILVDEVRHVPRIGANDPFEEYWGACVNEDTTSESPYGGILDRLEAFRKLLSLGRNKLSSFALRSVFLHRQFSEDANQDGVNTEAEMKDEVFSVIKDWVGEVDRQFFITSLGYYGAWPKSVKEGDLVVILLGGNVPFLLRKNKGTFYLIEECCKPLHLVNIRAYRLMSGPQDVQGFMDGECFEQDDYGGRVCREFCLV